MDYLENYSKEELVDKLCEFASYYFSSPSSKEELKGYCLHLLSVRKTVEEGCVPKSSSS